MTRFETKSINLMLMQIVGPALIILMVSSLVFFLIEIFYRGPHTARLYWIMGLFTFAAVLVSRISVEEGRERAHLFGFVLAAATLISCMQIVTFTYAGLAILGPIVTTGLIAVVMWSSSKLTWDCTVVDRSRDASATGLVDIFRKQFNLEAQDQTREEERETTIEKIVRWLSGGHQKNTPGIWVFYFAVFAFPVFGLGQWFVEDKSKTWVYLLFALYLGSTLCLLMTTSLLGLERYLAKRKLHVPEAVARNWIIVGASFAIAMVLLVLLIPKPVTSSSMQDWLSALTSPVRKTSKLAAGKDGQKDTPEAKKQQVNENADRQAEAEQGDGGEDKKDSSEASGDRSGDSGSDDQAEQPQDQQQNQQQRNHQSDDGNKNPQQKNQARPQQRNENNKADKNRQSKDAKPPKDQLDQKGDPPTQQRQQNKSQLSKIFQQISNGVRWLIYVVGFVAGCFLIWMFKDELAKLLSALFGKKKVATETETVSKAEVEKPPASYRSFSDPFRSGKVNSMRASQVLEYSREALEAWAREAGLEVQPELTLDELAREIAGIDKQVASYARQFAEVYSRSAFSLQKVSREELNPLIKLWRAMDRVYAQMKRPSPVVTS